MDSSNTDTAGSETDSVEFNDDLMDVPSTSQSQSQHQRKARPKTVEKMTIVRNIMSWVQSNAYRILYRAPNDTNAKLVSEMTGISLKSVYRYANMDESKYQSSDYTPNVNPHGKGGHIKVTPVILEAITDVVLDIYRSGKQPTASNVLEEVRQELPMNLRFPTEPYAGCFTRKASLIG